MKRSCQAKFRRLVEAVLRLGRRQAAIHSATGIYEPTPEIRRVRTLVGVAVALAWSLSALSETTNAPARVSYDAFRVISDRNIFNPNRVARGSPRTTRSAATPAAHVEAFSLVGIMGYEKGLFAFFEGTKSDFNKVLQADAAIGPGKVTSVQPDVVKLTVGTNDFAMKVGMEMRREDEGEWFLSTGGETSSRRRSVFSRTLTNGEPASLTATNGLDGAGGETEPEIIVVESETITNPAAGETPPGNGGADGTTDPVLLRLMQRRQEMNQ